jgi:cytochrome c peroxidase
MYHMKPSALSFLIITLGTFLGSTASSASEPQGQAAGLRARAKEVIEVLPDKMPGSEKDTPELVELGRKLYFDKRMSMNQSQSCNTCHDIEQARAGVDNQPTSPGAFGKRGDRNSPTVLNAGLHFAQFWDGRAATLEEQAKGPILNPIEMGMPDEKEVLRRLNSISEYQAAFSKVFPGAGEKITYNNVAKAIAAFERTLLTHDRLDDFLKGHDEALSAAELRGLDMFLEIGCAACHNGSLLGASSYQKAGLINPYENTKDLGRFDVTKDDSDKFKFKVPSLRNVALTGPYFHDGAVPKLADVVIKMAWMQLGRKLTDAEASSLAAFLNTLSDKGRTAGQRREAL